MNNVSVSNLENEHNCPHCDKRLNAFATDDLKNKPKEGDFCICFHCSELLHVAKSKKGKLQFEKATQLMLIELAGEHPDVYVELMNVQKQIRNRKKK